MTDYMDAICNDYSKKYVFILQKNEYKKVYLNDIVMIEASRSYCTVRLANGESFVMSIPLIKAQENLPPDYFIRISRSYVINLRYVNAISGNSVRINSKLFLISPPYRKIIFDTFVFLGGKRKL